MRVNKFVPLTLENVGSIGRFFTDKTILKTGTTVVAGLYVGLVVFGQVALLLPKIIAVIASAIAGIYLTILLIRYWVLQEKLLVKLFRIMDKYKIIEASEFSDVYIVNDNGICMHESGHVSALVEINLNTTIGLSTKEIDQMYMCFELFESRLLNSGVTFKTFGIEFVKDSFPELDGQYAKLKSSTIPNIKDVMLMRGKYIRVYTEEAGHLDKVVYSIATDMHDADYLITLLRRVEPLFRHPSIHSFVHLKTKEELNKFGREYFKVKYFNLTNDSEDELIDVLKFEED